VIVPTVWQLQHVRNQLTVDSYETHARIALEEGDKDEFNQCQNVLKSLHAHKLGGSPVEFFAYRIIYWCFGGNDNELLKELSDLTPSLRTAPEIRHALRVRNAVLLPDFVALFKLFSDAPNMSHPQHHRI